MIVRPRAAFINLTCVQAVGPRQGAAREAAGSQGGSCCRQDGRRRLDGLAARRRRRQQDGFATHQPGGRFERLLGQLFCYLLIVCWCACGECIRLRLFQISQPLLCTDPPFTPQTGWGVRRADNLDLQQPTLLPNLLFIHSPLLRRPPS